MSDDPKTLFALSEVALGLMPAANGLQRLMDLAGLRVALDYGVTGKPMSPAKAKQLGVANDVVPVNRLEDVAARLAGALASGRSRAEQAGTAGARRRPEWLMRRLLEANPAARRMLCRQARKGARIATGGHHRAPDRIIDVLWAHAARGPTASTAEAARAMGELLVSTPARRLMELSLAVAELRRELGLEPNGCDLDAARGAFRELERAARPMMAPYLREAECLIREGATMDWVDSCLVDWGWPAGTLPAAFSRGVHRRVTVDAPAPTVPREEVQMRCTLQFVNEALFCLGGGAVRCPRDGDVGAVLGLGFPAFRGGPFRYVDAVGAREILRRVEGYQARFGQRWTPAPLLVELANADRRLYPRPLRLSTVTT